MWQIELVNFPIHPFSQPANVCWALGVGNMQGSRASKMKLSYFQLLSRGRMPFCVLMDISLCSGVSKTWFIIIAWVRNCWVNFMVILLWISNFIVFFLFAQCDLAISYQGHRHRHCWILVSFSQKFNLKHLIFRDHVIRLFSRISDQYMG